MATLGKDYLVELVRHASAGSDRKFVWRLESGDQVESVVFGLADDSFIVPDGMERLPNFEAGTRVCISSQAGCNVACSFCATGLQPVSRNLTAEEIAGQVFAMRELGLVTGAVSVIFAGMGEPLHNPDAVFGAADLLLADPLVEHVSLSTMGVVPEIERLAEKRLPISLYLSLHATTDEIRNQIIPLNKKYPIADVLAAARRYSQISGSDVEVSYLLLEGVNDAPADADRLIDMLRGDKMPVKLLLWNDVPGLPLTRVDDEAAAAFCDRLVGGGLSAFVIPSKGRSLEAGCGQMITTPAAQRRLELAQKRSLMALKLAASA